MKYVRMFFGLCFIVGCGPANKVDVAQPPTQASNAGYESPGGMWMPQQLSEHADTLTGLGLDVDVDQLANPLAPPLAAVVSLGGCSASFVSPQGLVITNHHCVQGTLQYNSTPEQNLVKDGYLAQTTADEKWNGPTSRIYVTQAFTDVSDKVLAGLDGVSDDRKRFDEIEAREKALVAECESGRPHLRCSVRRFFRGDEYYLIEQLEIRDVRLVYAPPQGVGFFGGDEDNWMWPRQTGDFSFYRAYVGKDGLPADYAADNVPFAPKHYLRVASKPLAKGDLVMVAGYPGRTYRYRTSDEVKEAIEWYYPRRIARFEEYLAALDEVSKTSEATAIKASGWIFGLQNALKNNRGMMDGLVKGGLAAEKAEIEQELSAWIAADAERQATYGGVLAGMRELQEQEHATRDRDSAFAELRFVSLFNAARSIVRMAEERPKADAERDPDFQERNWSRFEAGMRRMSKTYDRNLDLTMMTLALQRAMRQSDDNASWLNIMMPGQSGQNDEDAVGDAVMAMYEASKLEDEEMRVQLFREASTEQLSESNDPLIRAALALRPFEKELEAREKRIAGARSTLEPRYMQALRAFSPTVLAPDANGTLRVTYGTVRGYQPRANAPVYEPFTKLSTMVDKHEKHDGAEPFNAPEPVLTAIRAQRFGNYVDESIGEVPVNFLSDVDTTGGNSGSATLNGRGELVGLLFDGNYESMASDWLFIPSLTRGIHVDIRYALWMLDIVEEADHLIKEMGLTPSADSQ